MDNEVKTPYMMYERALVVFKAAGGWMRTFVCLKVEASTNVEEAVTQLLNDAPAKHVERRRHLEKVHAQLEKTFPQRHDEWMLQREMCIRYEHARREWYPAVKKYDSRKVAGLLGEGEECPPEPECQCEYPLGPEPVKPEPLRPDAFTGTFKECVEEIQAMDLEEVGLKPIDISEKSETFVFSEE